jgi:hypothetical protein
MKNSWSGVKKNVQTVIKKVSEYAGKVANIHGLIGELFAMEEALDFRPKILKPIYL